MTLLAPLGLLGLLGVVALIIIYIIRPNYQQKFISSTYVWKLSLKYRKKKIPTSKLRNLLLILCQVLILTACAAILAKPAQVLKVKVDETEVIAILDSSASMRTTSNGETRFERAVASVQDLSDDILNQNGIVSIILADEESDFLVQRATPSEKSIIEDRLYPLLDAEACSYGESDVTSAIALCEEVLAENPSAKIYLYTDMHYANVPEGIEIVDVTEAEEWNAAILNASVELENNYYTFYVDVAYYCDEEYDSSDKSTFTVNLNVTNANPDENNVGVTIPIAWTVSCERNQAKRLIFITQSNYDEIAQTVETMGDGETEYVILGEDQMIYSYSAAYITIDTSTDSFTKDNEFNIFNGQKEIIKVQYASAGANPFFRSVLFTIQSAFSEKWDIRITEVKKEVEPALEGFDLYLFEHSMPEKMPEDGVVILANPNRVPDGAGFRIEEVKAVRESIGLTPEAEHPLLNLVNPGNITLSQYTVVSDDGTSEGIYQTLMACDASPVVMVKNEPASKVLLLNFSIHYSNFALLYDFPIFMCNVFDYFFPTTAEKFAFEVYESVSLNARGEELTVSRGSEEIGEPFTVFPAILELDEPGNYILTQTVGMGNRQKQLKEYIFVKVPSEESNIWKGDQTLENPYKIEEEKDYFKDWLPYLAGAIVALLFIEWWLQSRESM